ncbi:MAG: hypothetical protein EBQ92_00560 [Proteobacteria bacterium]|nr:hypothetical protein [Pseudomonadota bacterium]
MFDGKINLLVDVCVLVGVYVWVVDGVNRTTKLCGKTTFLVRDGVFVGVFVGVCVCVGVFVVKLIL